MMPLLFILLLLIVVASCMLPNADKGIEFLFKPDTTKLTGDVFLGALGQSFYSMSIAMAIAKNVGESYRLGVELEAAWKPVDWFRWDANATLSKNRAKEWEVTLMDSSWVSS